MSGFAFCPWGSDVRTDAVSHGRIMPRKYTAGGSSNASASERFGNAKAISSDMYSGNNSGAGEASEAVC